ncbi:MAG TPA: hypothetical protein PLE54_17040 [Burkholderiaceae bacterium]|nr:hypothetical protein [Burkholderiaceae bacterium]HQR72314.1 hypothetical protein [Burkholderiaceae bacterium]
MKIHAWLAVAAVLAALLPAASAADPCALLSPAEAGQLLGQAAVKATPSGPEKDEDSGGQLTYCTYRAAAASGLAAVVSVVEFRSEAEARKQLTRNLVQGRMDDETAKVSEEGNIGEKSMVGATDKAAMVVFLKKNKVIGVSLGGSGAAATPASKAALLKAAQAVASKI